MQEINNASGLQKINQNVQGQKIQIEQNGSKQKMRNQTIMKFLQPNQQDKKPNNKMQTEEIEETSNSINESYNRENSKYNGDYKSRVNYSNGRDDDGLQLEEENEESDDTPFIQFTKELGNQQTVPRQYLYILPHFVEYNDYWPKVKTQLMEIRDRNIIEYSGIFKAIQYILRLKTLPQHQGEYNLKNLENFIEKKLDIDEQNLFIDEILPFMAQLAIDSEHLFGKSFNLLVENFKEVTQEVIFSRLQIASLLSLMFFCATVGQITENLPQLYTFCTFFEHDNQMDSNKVRLEKLMFLYSYFKQIYFMNFDGILEKEFVRFSRSQGPSLCNEKWQQNEKKLKPVFVSENEGIDDIEQYAKKLNPEDKQSGHLKVLFANKYIGGGVMRMGQVQEEIFWMDYPELFVQRLFIEKLSDNEAVYCFGAKQFSMHKGYGSQTIYAGQASQIKPLNKDNMLENYMVSLDAQNFQQLQNYSENKMTLQIKSEFLLRELNKAYIGFKIVEKEYKNKISSVVTGNWGCGHFGGNLQLKFLLQWMAASANNLPMYYCTFNQKELQGIQQVIQYFEGETVSHVYKNILQYKKDSNKKKQQIAYI